MSYLITVSKKQKNIYSPLWNYSKINILRGIGVSPKMEKDIEFSRHALKAIKERNLSEGTVKDILCRPGQVVSSYSNRKISQKVVEYNNEKFLVRVIYEETETKMKVITVYRTTKMEKYRG